MRLTSNTTNTINDIINHLLSNRVVATCVVVSSILLAANQHLRVEELTIGASSNLVDRGRVEIDEERARHVLAATGLGEESLIGTTVKNILAVGVRTTIGT